VTFTRSVVRVRLDAAAVDAEPDEREQDSGRADQVATEPPAGGGRVLDQDPIVLFLEVFVGDERAKRNRRPVPGVWPGSSQRAAAEVSAAGRPAFAPASTLPIQRGTRPRSASSSTSQLYGLTLAAICKT
jgi:hypothetical protein